MSSRESPQHSTAPSPSAPSAEPAIGKTPATMQLDGYAGAPGAKDSDYIEEGPQCERPAHPAAGCFLQPAQRGRLIALTGLRIGEAEEHCQVALLALRLERVLTKEQGELGWIAELLLDAVGAHLVASATHGLIAGAKAMPAARALLARVGIELAEDELGAFRQSSSLHKQIHSAVDASKRAAKSRLIAGQRALSERALALAYLAEISVQAGIAYQVLRETAPAQCTDAELVELYDSLDARAHSVAAYEEAFEAKISRLLASGVGEIGRQTGSPLAQLDDLPHAPAPVTERRVAWTYSSGRPAELIYDDTAMTETGTKTAQEPVPREFWHTAIARHKAAWGAPPSEIKVDAAGVPIGPVRQAIAGVQAAHDAAADEPTYIGEPPVSEPAIDGAAP